MFEKPVAGWIEPQLPQRKIFSHFWKPMPHWFMNSKIEDHEAFVLEGQSKWKKSIIEIEEALKKKNSREAFAKISKMC